jgi:anaerobic ribonucleoside-triphosphate reductase
MSDEWIKERLKQLRGQKAQSDHQRMLMLLADKEVRTVDEERKFAALIRAEKAAERAQKARASASRIINEDKLAERKARDQRSILKSALIDWTVLEGRDIGELLGALLEFAENGMAEDRLRWKRHGDALLARRSMQTRDT